METSKIVTTVVIVALVVALGYVLLRNGEEPQLSAAGSKCIWMTGFFNPVEETEVLGGTDCTFKKDNYDPFKTGNIDYTVSGTGYSQDDACTSSSLMNEYWCDSGVAQRTLGFCTLGCKGGTNSLLTANAILTPTGSCEKRVRVCGSAAPALDSGFTDA